MLLKLLPFSDFDVSHVFLVHAQIGLLLKNTKDVVRIELRALMMKLFPLLH